MLQNEQIPRRLVKDAIWGMIPLLPWEKSLLDHPIFARLHNILQNSTAFRVYPSLRTSRFAHSLGVMHVATDMFRAALIESDDLYLQKDSLASQGIKTLWDEAVIIENLLDSSNAALLKRHIRAIFPLRLADGQPAPDHFLLALAALRLAALLHDVGHLPASHIFEFAIEDAASQTMPSMETSATTEQSSSPNSRSTKPKKDELKHESTYSKFLNWSKNFKPGKLHEEVGRLIMQFLEYQVDKRNAAYLYGPLIGIAKNILHNTTDPNSTLLCCRSFISSMLDADRIDFVRRDTESSGLLQSSVDYWRLLRFMCLKPVNLNPEAVALKESAEDIPKERNGKKSELIPHLSVMPAPRAYADIEKLLTERFQDYRYIAAHHRVHLGDELLARCIQILLRKNRLTKMMDLLLNLAEGEGGDTEGAFEGEGLSKLLSICTEFDDAWLEMQIRDLWLAQDKQRSFEKLILNAHMLNGSTLLSAFKREDSFYQFVEDENNKDFQVNFEWFLEIRRDFAKNKHAAAQEKILKVAKLVKENKLDWEQILWQKYKCLILIGDLSGKLKTGFPLSNRLISDRMEDLIPASEFLTSKLGKATPLNIWFDSSLIAKSHQIKMDVCQLLADVYRLK